MADEKRLIDAEALCVQVMDASYWDNQDEDVIWNLVQDAPTVDAVEVVRCKDCKHYKTRSQSAKWKPKAPCCTRAANIFTKPDDFCSYGERREGE